MKSFSIVLIAVLGTFLSAGAKAETYSVPEIHGQLNNFSKIPSTKLGIQIDLQCLMPESNGMDSECGYTQSPVVFPGANGQFTIRRFSLRSQGSFFQKPNFFLKISFLYQGKRISTLEHPFTNCRYSDWKCVNEARIDSLRNFSLIEFPELLMMPQFTSGISAGDFLRDHDIQVMPYGTFNLNIKSPKGDYDFRLDIFNSSVDIFDNYFLIYPGSLPADLTLNVDLKINNLLCAPSNQTQAPQITWTLQDGFLINGIATNKFDWSFNDIRNEKSCIESLYLNGKKHGEIVFIDSSTGMSKNRCHINAEFACDEASSTLSGIIQPRPDLNKPSENCPHTSDTAIPVKGTCRRGFAQFEMDFGGQLLNYRFEHMSVISTNAAGFDSANDKRSYLYLDPIH